VEFSGRTALAPTPSGDVARLAAASWLTRIYRDPHRAAPELGYLRAGALVATIGEPVTRATQDCGKGWQAIAPRGHVCLDDMESDVAAPLVRATSRRPDFERRLPYMYGTVTRGGPVYARLPSAKELRQHEPNLAEHLRRWRQDKVSGARYGLDVWLTHTTRVVPGAIEALEQKVSDELPFYLDKGGRVPALAPVVVAARADAVEVDTVHRRQGRSFIESFLFEGRRYNVTPDLTLIPADRFRAIRGSTFSGWRVPQDLELPFALVRRVEARKWRWKREHKRMSDAGPLAWRSAVELTGQQIFVDDVLHYETKEGFWVDDRHASRIDPPKKWPKWAKQGEKWIDVNISKQTLAAFEGKRLVYATLVSTGEAGLDDAKGSTATTQGIFRVAAKWATVTMDSDVAGEEFELRDVPYVQYFEEGYALHGAYWHDRFGQPKSHGCVNLSPEDSRRLFFWTEPALPAGWHGVRDAKTGTVVWIHG
jgi:hypothetical protein